MSGIATKLQWYKNRLLCMSAPEMLFRIRHSARRPFEKPRFSKPDYPDREGTIWLRIPEGIVAEPYKNCADKILDGYLSMFGVSELEVGHPPDWKNAVTYPGPSVTKDIHQKQHRFADLSKDIKLVWEPSRHHHLVTLAQAHVLSGEKKYLDGLILQLESWLDACPYPSGPNWMSPLEAGIRLINWSIVWQLIGGKNGAVFDTEQGNELLQRWLLSINEHCHFIARNFSAYSSANNHLIGEAAGLFVASLTWPMWWESAGWRDQTHAILSEEMPKQVYEDGVGKEQAFSYMQFVLDFCWVSGIVGRANSIDFSTSWWDRIEAMLEFIASVMDVQGNVPMVGDADDGYVFMLSREKRFSPFRSQLATGAFFFRRKDLLEKAGKQDDKTQWLMGKACNEVELKSENCLTRSQRRQFPNGGYYILGSDFDTPKEVRMLVDAGPLGYLPIAAHGHSDALSVMLSIGGNEFLIDPGTFSYNSDPAWRHYFRGTSSHNTLRVDGHDQSEYCGSFMWREHADTSCLLANQERVLANHTGYCRLADPLIHRREVVYDEPEKTFYITDTLACKASHYIEQYWHFAENCDLDTCQNGFIVRNNNCGIRLHLDASLTNTTMVKADDGAYMGWVSREFGLRKPGTTIVCNRQILGHSVLETRIICEQAS